MGCARRGCAGRNGTPGWFVVCEYWPRGNVVLGGDGDKWKLFRENVKEQVEGKKGGRVEGGVGSAGVGRREMMGFGGVWGAAIAGAWLLS